MASMTIELSEYVIDAIANAVVKKMQQICDYYDADNKTCRRSEVPKEPCEDISRQVRKERTETHENACVCSDVLDRIRAEIFNACSDNYHMPVYKLSCEEIFEIIDKYRPENEDK